MKMIKRSFSLNRKQEPHEPRAALSQTDYYLIECQASGFCLREELRTFKLQEGDHVQVMGGELAEHDPSLLSFLWMFKYNKEEDLHRIVHVRTDLSLTSDQFECELAHGSLEEEQAFQIN